MAGHTVCTFREVLRSTNTQEPLGGIMSRACRCAIRVRRLLLSFARAFHRRNPVRGAGQGGAGSPPLRSAEAPHTAFPDLKSALRRQCHEIHADAQCCSYTARSSRFPKHLRQGEWQSDAVSGVCTAPLYLTAPDPRYSLSIWLGNAGGATVRDVERFDHELPN